MTTVPATGDTRNARSWPLAAIIILLVLNVVLLVALMSGTPPHPPTDVPLFAIGPFLGASLAIGAGAFELVRKGDRLAGVLVVAFVVTGLVTFGPQKYFDPAFPRIWPAVMTAQGALVLLAIWAGRKVWSGRSRS